MATMNEVLKSRKPVSETYAVGANRVHGNEMTLFEKRESKLTWMPEYYRPPTQPPPLPHQDRVPIRMGDKMVDVRSDETMEHGRLRYNEARKLSVEFNDKIQAMLKRKEEEELSKTNYKKRRWWYRARANECPDPVKTLRFSNLRLVPSELLNTKEVVNLQLTGCRLGDESMEYIRSLLINSYTLRRLNLQGNHITFVGVRELFQGLRNTKSLIDLDISLNPIGDEGASSLINAICEGNARANRLYRLNMGTCQLTSGCGHQIAHLLHELKSLQMLLLWRNQLGVVGDATRSGVSHIMEAVPHAAALRVLDLTANDISDQDMAAHCSERESELRRGRLQDIEKRNRVIRLQELRAEIQARRQRAVWDDEKMAVNRLERQADQELQRLHRFMLFDNRKKTAAQREMEVLMQDTARHTGGPELLHVDFKPRLVINGNYSILPSTFQRLKVYYDITLAQNPAMWVQQPRRYQHILNPRRQMGEPYQARDPLEYDEHNIFTWVDKDYDPKDHHERTMAIQAWRDAEDEKARRLKPAHFEKFKLNVHGNSEDMKGKKIVSGFSVTSGVNARLRETLDDDEAAGANIPANDQIKRLAATSHTERVVKNPAKVTVIDEDEGEDGQVIHVRRRLDADGNESVTITGNQDPISLEEQETLAARAREVPEGMEGIIRVSESYELGGETEESPTELEA